jgi:hypothetical protein
VFILLKRQLSSTFINFSKTSNAGTEVINLVERFTKSEKLGGAWLEVDEEDD